MPDYLLQTVRGLGFESPTPVQEQAIPLVLEGRDVAAEAPTGSGKTAAFALPLVHQLCVDSVPDGSVQTLVLAPTRELALQVASVFESLARGAPHAVAVLAVIGGQSAEDQIAALQSGVQVVVATPGRLLDFVTNGSIDLGNVRSLVLDEADKLLDLGFQSELGELLDALPADRQTLLFSATLPTKVLTLAIQALRDPATVRVQVTAEPVSGIRQRVLQVDRDRRRMLLQHLLRAEAWGPTLVFVATQRSSENLAKKLRTAKFTAMALHGGLRQPERIYVLDRFVRGELDVLVATDLAARGIDIPRLPAVVNFDLPRSASDYVHRIGRTGRAGEPGNAISFVDHDTERHFRLIEKRNDLRVPREQAEGFELTGAAGPRQKGPEAIKGKRKSKKDKLREQAALRAAEEAAEREESSATEELE